MVFVGWWLAAGSWWLVAGGWWFDLFAGTRHLVHVDDEGGKSVSAKPYHDHKERDEVQRVHELLEIIITSAATEGMGWGWMRGLKEVIGE